MDLKNIRTRRELTQKELSKKSGIAQSTIHYLEAGEQSPTERTIKKLAKALEIDIADLLRSDG